MYQKGFIKIILIMLTLLLASTLGYFILNNRSITLSVDEESIPTPSQQTSINDTTQIKQTSTIDLPFADEPPTDWQFIDANSFTLSLPSGWRFNKLQGKDSYVGEFIGDDTRLSFDFGSYSNALAEENDPKYVVTYKNIDGYRAKIVTPKIPGDGIVGVHFSTLENGSQKNKFTITGNNLTSIQQETAIKIFHTIKFKK